MTFEIERKYLLKSPQILTLLENEGVKLHEERITQFYTCIDKECEIRFRKSDKIFTKTQKIGSGMTRKEFEEKIDEELFEKSKKDCIGSLIRKKRYSFRYNDKQVFIDIYKKELKKLSILEVEFESQDSANGHLFPPLIQNEIIEEVTSDEKYKNQQLALYGDPKVDFDPSIVLKNIEKNPFKAELLIPAYLNSYEAIKLLFFSIYKKILFHEKEYILHEKNDDLHQLRVNIRKTRSLLQCIDGIFDENIKKRFVIDFKTIANSSNEKRDMDVFEEFLSSLDRFEAKFICEYLKQNNNEENKVLKLLNSDFYTITMQNWNEVLRDNDGFFKGESADFTYKKIAAISIYKRLKKMSKQIKLLDESVELDKFHSVRIEFKKLRYLTEYFLPLFNSKPLKKLIKISRKMQAIFGILQDRHTGENLLQKILHDEKYISNIMFVFAIENLNELIKDDIYSLRTKILIDKNELFDTINICLKDLKNYIGD